MPVLVFFSRIMMSISDQFSQTMEQRWDKDVGPTLFRCFEDLVVVSGKIFSVRHFVAAVDDLHLLQSSRTILSLLLDRTHHVKKTCLA